MLNINIQINLKNDSIKDYNINCNSIKIRNIYDYDNNLLYKVIDLLNYNNTIIGVIPIKDNINITIKYINL